MLQAVACDRLGAARPAWDETACHAQAQEVQAVRSVNDFDPPRPPPTHKSQTRRKSPFCQPLQLCDISPASQSWVNAGTWHQTLSGVQVGVTTYPVTLGLSDIATELLSRFYMLHIVHRGYLKVTEEAALGMFIF